MTFCLQTTKTKKDSLSFDVMTLEGSTQGPWLLRAGNCASGVEMI